MKNLNTLLLLCLFTYLSFSQENKLYRTQIEGQYIVKKSLVNNSSEIIQEVGQDHVLIESNDENFVSNPNYFPNYQYHGDYMEGALFGGGKSSKKDRDKHHKMIETFKAWEITKGSSEIIIAVTDNEFQMHHESLVDSWWINSREVAGNGIDDDGNGYVDDINGWDFIERDNQMTDNKSTTHGTHVAATIAGQKKQPKGAWGVAPNVKVMALRWYKPGQVWTSSIIAETYRYAVDNGAKIISTSYNIDSFVDDPAYRDAIRYAKSKGVIVVNSAGNNSKLNPPRQKVKELVLVCSLRSSDELKKSHFSNFGTGIDICAPGDPIYAATSKGKNRYTYMSGTSMATPVVSGVLGLIWSQYPHLGSEEVIEKLYQTSLNLDSPDAIESGPKNYNGKLGSGMVQAYNAVIE